MSISKKIIYFTLVFIGLITLFVGISFVSHYEYSNQLKDKLFGKINYSYIKKYFQKNCSEEKAYCSNLNDKRLDYFYNSKQQTQFKPIKNKKELKKLIQLGILLKVESNDNYVVDTLFYSYPYLLPQTKLLLDEIALSFQQKIENTTFRNAKLHVSSLLRTNESIKRLKKRNKNSVKQSSHLHGTTFDIDYSNFTLKDSLSNMEKLYLKDLLALTLHEFKEDKRCFVTYEVFQSCFHIVTRKSIIF